MYRSSSPRSRSATSPAPDLRPFAPDRFPVWIFHGAVFDGEETSYYGFPVYGEAGVKRAATCPAGS